MAKNEGETMTMRDKALIKKLKEDIMSLETQNYLLRRVLDSIKMKVDKALAHKFGRGLQ
jgi:hypothetical protein